MDIEGLKIIVTGGASGLGAATVRLLAARGASVAIFDIDEDAGRRVAEETGAVFMATDVSDENAVIRSTESFGKDRPARALINCAGIAPDMLLTRRERVHRLAAFERTMAINTTGTFLTCAYFATALRDVDRIGEETGVIINTSSIAAFDGQSGHVAYAASKGAINSMTLPMARDLARFHIRVMCIAPGVFDTPMMNDIPNPHGNPFGSQVPHPERLGSPDEFASLAAHVIENPMLNGEIIRLDGALRLGPH